MTEHLCIVCPQIRGGDPRVYERPHVCEGCRPRLRLILADVVDLYADLLDPPPVNAGEWRDEAGRPHRDPVAAELPAGPLHKVGGARVSGSRTPPLPLPLETLDLVVAVPNALDSWARDWQTYRWALLPAPTVPLLSAWLAERLEWACDHHPAVDDFAAELGELARRMRPRGPRAELKVGVPCRNCERLTLLRWPGSDYIECGSCALLMTPEEYERWTSLIASAEYRPWVREIVTRDRENVA